MITRDFMSSSCTILVRHRLKKSWSLRSVVHRARLEQLLSLIFYFQVVGDEIASPIMVPENVPSFVVEPFSRFT